MDWERMGQSQNVEDERGQQRPQGRLGGGGTRLGIGGTILLVIVALIFGQNPLSLLNGGTVGTPSGNTAPSNDQTGRFVSAILKNTETTWDKIFKGQYTNPKLKLFSGQTESYCGRAQTATGPFYCPADQKVYLDTSFFGELEQRFGAAGDFARAYVIAHEIGHHVQNQLGILDKIQAQQQKLDEVSRNALQVRVELQADCFAGVWGHFAVKDGFVPNQQEIRGALQAATAIGDDNLQRQSQGYVVPESFTHGSSDQRVRWFLKGLEKGDANQCNTFAARQL
jgi:uncharacterized protein